MSDQHPSQDQAHEPDDGKPTLWQTIHSILAGLLGVQSSKNRERDFTKGDAGNFIGVYVVMVLALVIGMVVTVNLVLDAAAK
ncbi:DUF2970 domain-containing protein [Alcanivorax sp.]|uniref:DUF2970 domain-containing protein n=1 Tax=Alcanivorax sp. TaxID=1872427 RepID=UPI000C0E7047|nr:DUF2970 domain-containing protein [Alcanivorax sp.]PHR65107.1 MAG: hypothetical protein COA55_12255 [Alcanivorax sp.]